MPMPACSGARAMGSSRSFGECAGEIATWAGPPGIVVVRPSSHKMWVKLQPCNYTVKVLGEPDRPASDPTIVQHQAGGDASISTGGTTGGVAVSGGGAGAPPTRRG